MRRSTTARGTPMYGTRRMRWRNCSPSPRRRGSEASGASARRGRGGGPMADGLLEAVRGLRLAHPELGPKPLLAKLREQQPDLAAGNKEVREALAALKAEESKATEAAAATPPAPPPPRRPLREGGAPRPLRRASLASAAPGCRRRWATAVRSIRCARSAAS